MPVILKKLNLGSGNNRIDGFISVDLYDDEADVRADICELPYEDESVSNIVSYQVIEHVPYHKSQAMFEEMYRVLAYGGTAILETNDFDYLCRAILVEGLVDKWVHAVYGQVYRPWDKERYDDWEENAASIHRNPWNEKRIREVAEPLGFAVRVQTMEEKHPDYKYPETLSVELTKLPDGRI